MSEKPQTESGYAREDTQLVVSATLTVATILGDLLEDLCIVGGLVPTLLIDVPAGAAEGDGHCGTNDLDVGMALAIFDEERYKEIAERLRRADFEHDTRRGNPIVQTWHWRELGVTIDFLIPQTEDAQRGGQIKHLEADFGAIVAPGLELAFDEREPVELDGTTLEGDRARRTVPVCGPGAYAVLKGFALRLRKERKDAYDLDYVLAFWPAGVGDIAARLAGHGEQHGETVGSALAHLRDDYATTTTWARDRARDSATPATRTPPPPTRTAGSPLCCVPATPLASSSDAGHRGWIACAAIHSSRLSRSNSVRRPTLTNGMRRLRASS